MPSSDKRPARRRPAAPTSRPKPALTGVEGGRYQPLSPADCRQIDAAVRHILAEIGLAEAPALVIETVERAGGRLTSAGRLTFHHDLIAAALQGLRRDFSLFGQAGKHELQLTGTRVHAGSGGAAPQIRDLESGRYRPSTLQLLFDAARIVDVLDHIPFFSRSLVAGDMPDLHSMDLNTAFACLSGTAKHVCTSISRPEHVAEIAELCYQVAGSQSAFEAKPFISLNINHAVPPLRFDGPACEVMAEATRRGIPVHANTFGQLGASSPVTMAGSVAQTIAETLAGMIFAWLIDPRARVIFGTRPMITDLRTGGMAGGSGEQALVMAATTQMAQYYGLPNSTIAGATDSKIADAQSGYEKALTVTLAAQAGSNLITQACGVQASLMGISLESYVIDNDMLGSILRSLSVLEVNETTLALPVIDAVVRGEGHFFGQAETLARMQSDFLYPEIGDRQSNEAWETEGSRDIRDIALEKTREILSKPRPDHISAELDAAIRARFDIRL
jgi:trimethylamine--corrinoid protein Co-methyltransferase